MSWDPDPSSPHMPRASATSCVRPDYTQSGAMPWLPDFHNPSSLHPFAVLGDEHRLSEYSHLFLYTAYKLTNKPSSKQSKNCQLLTLCAKIILHNSRRVKKNNWKWDTRSSDNYFSSTQHWSVLIRSRKGDVQHSLQELRPISTPWLHTLLRFHLVPINLVISQGT